MVIVTKSVDSSIAHPISDDFCFCLDTNDYVTQIANAPFIEMDITAGTPPIGTVNTFFGQRFATGTANTHNTYIFDPASSIVTANNIAAAFEKNAMLSGTLVRTNIFLSPAASTVEFRYFKKGYRQDFNFTGSAAIGFTPLQIGQGADFKYVEGYQYNYLLYKVNYQGNNQIYAPIFERQSFPPVLGTDGHPVPACVDFKDDIATQLKTTFLWSSSSPVFDLNFWSEFVLKIGEQKTRQPEGCGVDYGEILPEFRFVALNTVFQKYEWHKNGNTGLSTHKFSDFDHTKTTAARFLTNRPFINGKTTICNDEYGMLWFYLPFWEDPLYSVSTKFYNSSGVLMTQYDEAFQGDYQRVIAVPCAPMNFLMPTGTRRYTVEVLHDGGTVSEVLTFNITDCKCEKEQVFFVCDYGGYDTMRFTRTDEKTVNVSQTEICLDVPCSTGLESIIDGGMSQTNTEAFESFTLLSDKLTYNEENLNWFVSFKKSESRYILREMSNGDKRPFRLLVDSGETQIFRHGETVQLSVKCRYGFDLFTQQEG